MKKQFKNFTLYLIAVNLLLGCSALFPQRGEKRPPRLPDSEQIEQQVNELAEALSLSDQQKSEILTLHINHFNQAKTMMSDNPDREKMEQLRKELEEQVMAVLDDEQKVKYSEYMKNQKRPERQRRGRQ